MSGVGLEGYGPGGSGGGAGGGAAAAALSLMHSLQYAPPATDHNWDHQHLANDTQVTDNTHQYYSYK